MCGLQHAYSSNVALRTEANLSITLYDDPEGVSLLLDKLYYDA